MRVSDKAPYYTTFRRKVRRLVMPVSAEVPLDMVKDVMRRDLNERKHTIIEATWADHPGWYTVTEFREGESHRTVSVRYVTGGMRHGLGPSVDWLSAPGEVEFARAHGAGFGR
jgi:hypothetical protein